jgi:hypothetical protein
MGDWELALVQRMSAEWERKRVVLHWNDATQSWEANGTPVADRDAAIANERTQGWTLTATVPEQWGLVRLSTGEIVPPSATRTFSLFFDRRRH